jgi:hypothetical protein
VFCRSVCRPLFVVPPSGGSSAARPPEGGTTNTEMSPLCPSSDGLPSGQLIFLPLPQLSHFACFSKYTLVHFSWPSGMAASGRPAMVGARRAAAGVHSSPGQEPIAMRATTPPNSHVPATVHSPSAPAPRHRHQTVLTVARPERAALPPPRVASRRVRVSEFLCDSGFRPTEGDTAGDVRGTLFPPFESVSRVLLTLVSIRPLPVSACGKTAAGKNPKKRTVCGDSSPIPTGSYWRSALSFACPGI